MKKPGKRMWHHHLLFTDRRVLATKAGWGGILAKAASAGADVGVGAGVGMLDGVVAATLDGVINQSKEPKLEESRRVASAQVDALMQKPDAYQVFWQDVSSMRLKKGGFLSDDRMWIEDPRGTLEAKEIGWVPELAAVLRHVIGTRLTLQ